MVSGDWIAFPLDMARDAVLEVDRERLLESEGKGVVAVTAP